MKEKLAKNRLLNEEEILRRKRLAKMMQEQVEITPNAPDKESFLLNLLTKKIPLLAGFLQSIKGTASSITNLLINVQDNASKSLQGASSGFQYAALGLATVNFFRIPMIFLFAAIAGEKPPFTLSTAGEWIYSAALLGLTLAAILAPAVAPALGLAAAGLVFIASIVSLVNMIYQRHQLKKSLLQVNEDIKNTEDILEYTRKEAQELESALANLDKGDSNYKQKATEICRKIDELALSYKKTKNDLQSLHNKKFLDEKTLKGMGGVAFMDKGVGIALASLAIAGLVLSLFFPPVGLGILVASAGLGTLYLVSRISYSFLAPKIGPLLKKVGDWFANKFSNKTDNEPSPDLDKTLNSQTHLLAEEQQSISATTKHEVSLSQYSTLKTMKGLFGEDAAQQLHALKDNAIEMEKLDSQLLKIAETENRTELLKFISNLAAMAQAENCPFGDLQNLCGKFFNMNKTLPLLEKALDEIKNGDFVLSEAERADLQESQPVIAALLQQNEKAMDLSFLSQSTIPTSTLDVEHGKQEQLSLK